jgi:phosphatidylinositol kinase/protein kinase (PI-3  family)
MSPDLKVTCSNQGFIEESQVPFRNTPNIKAGIGEHYIQGTFVRFIAMFAAPIKEHKEEFDPILRLLMREDILS